jgi:hypothetical protein
MSSKRQNAVRSLSSLYTVVIGVALSLSAVQLVNRSGGILSIPLAELLLFLSFIFTLVPFYHGALRHLDDAYLENSNLHIRAGALILDVLLLISHGMVFVVLSLLLAKPGQFAWLLVAVLAVDVVWGALVYYGASTHSKDGAEGKWALINLIFVVVSGVLLLSFDIGLQLQVDPTKVSAGVFAVSLLRTIADYGLCWAFYFPTDE